MKKENTFINSPQQVKIFDSYVNSRRSSNSTAQMIPKRTRKMSRLANSTEHKLEESPTRKVDASNLVK